MEVKHKLECLKFISQVHRSQFDERRRHEWKIVFTLLTFYVFIVATIYGRRDPLPSDDLKLAVWIIFPVLAVLTTIFLAKVHMANGKNKTFAEKAENAIEELLKGDEPKSLALFCLKDSKNWVSWRGLFKSGKQGRWGWVGQVVMLFAFSIFLAVLLTLS